jgi:hypothetical protein
LLRETLRLAFKNAELLQGGWGRIYIIANYAAFKLWSVDKNEGGDE